MCLATFPRYRLGVPDSGPRSVGARHDQKILPATVPGLTVANFYWYILQLFAIPDRRSSTLSKALNPNLETFAEAPYSLL